MTEPQRRLAAVWFADIVGYTTLSARDEPAAFRLVGHLQQIAREEVERAGGRIVKFLGDGALAEFATTETAVRSAIALQERYTAAVTGDGVQSALRIGVHLGEVTATDDGDLYGDGINTAARLQHEATPGGIMVSEDTWRQLRQRPEFQFMPAGELQLKGLSSPIAGYEVRFAAGPVPVTRRRHRRPRTWAVLAGVAALLGAGFLSLRYTGLLAGESLIGAGVLEQRDPILIADFTNQTGDARFGDVVTETLRIDLAQSDALTLVQPERVRATLQRMERDPAVALDEATALEVARREGVKAVLAGEVTSVGGQIRISARLLSPGGGEVLVALRETAADSAALLGAVDAISSALRRRIGESLRTVRASPPLEQVTTHSFPALVLYTQATKGTRNGTRSPAQAIGLLQEATSLDSAFASAYRAMGVYHNLLGHRQAVWDALARAYAHRTRLTDYERYMTVGTYHHFVTQDFAQAIEAFETCAELYPEANAPLDHLWGLYADRGDWELAWQAAERELALDSTLPWLYPAVVWLEVQRSGVQRGQEAVAAYARKVPADSISQLELRLALAWFDGDFGTVDGMLGHRSFNIYWRAAGAELHGRFHAARDDLRSSLSALGNPSALDHAQYGIAEANIALEAGDSAAAVAIADEVLPFAYEADQVHMDPVPYSLAVIYAGAGRVDRARALLSEYDRRTKPQVRAANVRHRLRAEGLLALAAGEFAQAANKLESWSRHPACFVCVGHPELGRAYERLGRRDDAIALYERFLATPNSFRVPPAAGFFATALEPQWTAPVLERLGALYEQKGDRQRAAAAYARLIELWKDGDPLVRARVARARARLAALRA